MHRAALLLLALHIPFAHADAALDTLEQVSRCSAIADSTERLKCFDRVAPAAKDAQVPKPADFGRPAARVPEPAQIVAHVRQVSKTVRGRAIFELDNGQVWRQIDSDDSDIREPAPGAMLKVTIEHGLLDSYNLTIEGRNGLVKVRRIQ
jgi:hypothetical protein